VVLAVSLALMALVAATATRSGSAGPGHLPRATATTTTTTRGHHAVATAPTTVPTPGTPDTVATATSTPLLTGASGLSHSASGPEASAGRTVVSTTTTTAAPVSATTTTQAAGAGGQSYPGYLQPPQDSSTTYGFTGQGATRITVTWSDATYLTLTVTCPADSQSTGGSSAIALSIPDAQGACQATLSESSTEDDQLSYTLTITPDSGT
jgi:hypothetical protein